MLTKMKSWETVQQPVLFLRYTEGIFVPWKRATGNLRLKVRTQLWGRSLGLSTDLPCLLLVVRAKLETQTLEPASPPPPWRELPNA